MFLDNTFLSEFLWYRKLRKGKWAEVRLDINERYFFWVKYDNDDRVLYQCPHTIIHTENHE